MQSSGSSSALEMVAEADSKTVVNKTASTALVDRQWDHAVCLFW